MARSVASVGVSVVAKTGRFNKGFKSAASRLDRFRKSVHLTTSRLAKLTAGVTAAAGAALTLLTKRASSSIDATAKLADRIGSTTEAIEGLKHAADITGAGGELMAKSLDVMAKRLGEAATGTGEAKDALRLLNLDVHRLIAMDPADAFKEIAEATRAIADEEVRAAVTSDLFSRAGLKLGNTINLGRVGLSKMQKEAALLGKTFSRIDAAQVEAANDAITRMKAALSGIGTTIAIKIAPYVERLAKGATEAFIGLRRSISRFFDWFEANIGNIAATVAAFALKVEERFYAVISSLTNAWGTMVGGFARLIEAFGGATKDLRALEQALKGVGVTFAWMSRRAEDSIDTSAMAVKEWVDGIVSGARKAAEALVHSIGAAKTPRGGLFGFLLSKSGVDLPSVKSIQDTIVKGVQAAQGRLAGLGSMFGGLSGAAGAGGPSFGARQLGRYEVVGASAIKKLAVEDKPLKAAVDRLFTWMTSNLGTLQ